MPEDRLVWHCAPTLAGIKTGSMYQCSFESAPELWEFLRGFNRSLGEKGLRMLPLRTQGNSALVYLYRPGRLARDLQNEEARRILLEQGYDLRQPGSCVCQLIRRFRTREGFPHEVGLFLGYPPEDVRGFIEHRPCRSCQGFWKVYGDREKAERLFRSYRKCTETYCALFSRGRSIRQLAVAG